MYSASTSKLYNLERDRIRLYRSSASFPLQSAASTFQAAERLLTIQYRLINAFPDGLQAVQPQKDLNYSLQKYNSKRIERAENAARPKDGSVRDVHAVAQP